ncbi:MAG: hypothetical protein LBQ24_03865 [Candidatus Peribacteria bacterium]|nr:hypothetical protein [Candidatus Peribacteria bacterium]
MLIFQFCKLSHLNLIFQFVALTSQLLFHLILIFQFVELTFQLLLHQISIPQFVELTFQLLFHQISIPQFVERKFLLLSHSIQISSFRNLLALFIPKLRFVLLLVAHLTTCSTRVVTPFDCIFTSSLHHQRNSGVLKIIAFAIFIL